MTALRETSPHERQVDGASEPCPDNPAGVEAPTEGSFDTNARCLDGSVYGPCVPSRHRNYSEANAIDLLRAALAIGPAIQIGREWRLKTRRPGWQRRNRGFSGGTVKRLINLVEPYDRARQRMWRDLRHRITWPFKRFYWRFFYRRHMLWLHRRGRHWFRLSGVPGAQPGGQYVPLHRHCDWCGERQEIFIGHSMGAIRHR